MPYWYVKLRASSTRPPAAADALYYSIFLHSKFAVSLVFRRPRLRCFRPSGGDFPGPFELFPEILDRHVDTLKFNKGDIDSEKQRATMGYMVNNAHYMYGQVRSITSEYGEPNRLPSAIGCSAFDFFLSTLKSNRSDPRSVSVSFVCVCNDIHQRSTT